MRELTAETKKKKIRSKKCLLDENQIEDILDNSDNYSFNFEKVYSKAKKRTKKSLLRLKKSYREFMDEKI